MPLQSGLRQEPLFGGAAVVQSFPGSVPALALPQTPVWQAAHVPSQVLLPSVSCVLSEKLTGS